MGLTWSVFSLRGRFITKRGLKVCADPQVDWVKKAVETVDNRKTTSQSKPTGAQQPTSTVVARAR